MASFLRAHIPEAPGAAAGDDTDGWEGEKRDETDEQVPIVEMMRRRKQGRREQMQVTTTLTRLYSDLDVAGGGGGGEGGEGKSSGDAGGEV